MKCHYEVLAVSLESNDDEIKKAYRKLALQWHPDKNPDNVEECTKQFQLIQQAYDVLSDPQERAWYDKHREAILKGGLGHGDEYEDNSLDVYQYFNSSCYSGFGDDEKGFYAVYGEVFKKISLEDQEYMNCVNTAPDFGNSLSTYEESVGIFYAYWESYSTAKSFVWVEKYDTREAPNRQIRRLMEQDNKKLRDKARKERNEEVRALVAYVRKRDRRVQAYKVKLEERAIEIAKRAEEKKKRDRQERLKKLENYKESSWSSMSELERELKQLEMNVAQQFGDVDSDTDVSDEELAAADASAAATDDKILEDIDEIEYYDSLYCIACKKSFKSDKALDNHNGSKKHMENVYLLQLEMADDDNLVDTPQENIEVSEEEEETQPLNNSRSKSKKQKKKRRQQLKVQALNETDQEDEEKELEAGKESDEPVAELKTNGVEERLQSESLSTDKETTATESEVINDDSNESTKEDLKSQKKQPNKKSKTSVETRNLPQSATGGNSEQSSSVCNKCHQVFSTRNKLFDHIKVTGHALHLESQSTSIDSTVSNSKSKSKKGKRK